MKNFKIAVSFLFLFFFFGVINANALESGDFSYTVNSDGATVTITNYSATGPKDVVIPSTIDGKAVTVIGLNAFYSKLLTSVVIPDSVTSLEKGAFAYNKLTSIIIPDNGILIGENAFLNNLITSVTIPGSVKIISKCVFQNNKITDLTIQEGVEEIGTGAFTRNNLTSLNLPNTIKKIDTVAFTWNKLESVIIPKGVETIGEYVFDYQSDGLGNKTLKKIFVLDKNTVFASNQFSFGFNSAFKYYGYIGSTTQTYANTKSYGFYPLKELTEIMVDDIPTQIFTGSPLTPTVDVREGLTTLVDGVDYTTTYSNNDAVGTGKVIITGLGDYFGSVVEKTFSIVKLQYIINIDPFTGATVSPDVTVNLDYDGSQNYTIMANSGYMVTSVLINGVENIGSLVGNVLTISNPTSDMTIVVKTERVVEPVTPIVLENPSTDDNINSNLIVGALSIIGLVSCGLFLKRRVSN